jgi:hypothetical protein
MGGKYLGWVKLHGGWHVICQGDSVGAAMGLLLEWIRARPTPPVASAVRRAGQHPDTQGDAGGPRTARNGLGAAGASPKARGTRLRKKGGRRG